MDTPLYIVNTQNDKTAERTNMMTIKQIRAALTDQNLSDAARKIGMTRQQLWLIVHGQNANPTLRTMERISEHFEQGE